MWGCDERGTEKKKKDFESYEQLIYIHLGGGD